MARGKDAHEARAQAVSALGKALSRRAGSACELCGDRDGCRPVEVEPLPEEPDVDDAVLLCARCRDALEARRLPGDPADYRFLEGPVWSEVLPVQVTAVRLLRRVDADWARETLDGLWLSEEATARLS